MLAHLLENASGTGQLRVWGREISCYTPQRPAAVQQGLSFRVLLLLTLSPHTWLSPLCRVGVTDTMIPRIRLDAERRLCWEPLSLNFYISIDLCLEAEIQFQGPIFRSWLVWVCWGAGQQLEK